MPLRVGSVKYVASATLAAADRLAVDGGVLPEVDDAAGGGRVLERLLHGGVGPGVGDPRAAEGRQQLQVGLAARSHRADDARLPGPEHGDEAGPASLHLLDPHLVGLGSPDCGRALASRVTVFDTFTATTGPVGRPGCPVSGLVPSAATASHDVDTAPLAGAGAGPPPDPPAEEQALSAMPTSRTTDRLRLRRGSRVLLWSGSGRIDAQERGERCRGGAAVVEAPDERRPGRGDHPRGVAVDEQLPEHRCRDRRHRPRRPAPWSARGIAPRDRPGRPRVGLPPSPRTRARRRGRARPGRRRRRPRRSGRPSPQAARCAAAGT